MAIEKLKLVYVEGNIRKVNKALMICCETGYFHINPPPDTAGLSLTARNLKDRGYYDRTLKRCKALANTLGIKLDENAAYNDIDYNLSVEFKNYIDGIYSQQSSLTEKKMELNAKLSADNAIYNNLMQLEGFDSDFAELFACKYMKIRFGRIPKENISKLGYYKDKTFFFFPFEEEENYTWCLYIAAIGESDSIDFLFRGLGFERTRLPDFLKGNSVNAQEALLARMEELDKELSSVDKALKEIADSERDKLSRVYSKLKAISASYELRTNVAVFNNHFQFSGYIPASEEESFKSRMTALGDVSVTARDAQTDTGAPVRLKNNFLFRPFEMFVKMYGLPSAKSFDPTPLVGITYMLLYGMMFGDVGQGILIVIIGLLLTKFTKLGLAPIITRIGISSTIFGVLYGSVFGNEEIITPFFRVPSIYRLLFNTAGDPPEHLDVFGASSVFLMAALGVGIVLILMSMIVNIIVSFKMEDLESAVFGASGICGLVFYASLLAGLGCSMLLGIEIMNTAYILVLIVLPLAAMFFKEPLLEKMGAKKQTEKKQGRTTSGNIDTGLKKRLDSYNEKKGAKKKSVGTFIIEGIIELFETCLTYVTNTMSYLRIGGFVLSHAGLMLVFNILAGMFDGVGSIIMLVFGNLFVTGFEGFIVGIQVLRLEFYELFSRYFKGGGKPFKAVSIGSDAA